MNQIDSSQLIAQMRALAAQAQGARPAADAAAGGIGFADQLARALEAVNQAQQGSAALAEAFDRGEKLAAYRTLASLQEYVLVDIPPRRVEIFRRAPENEWLFHEYLPGDEHCSFQSLDT